MNWATIPLKLKMRYVSSIFNFQVEVYNFKFEINERWDLCFPGIFWRKGFQFNCKSLMISRHKSLLLGDLCSNYQY